MGLYYFLFLLLFPLTTFWRAFYYQHIKLNLIFINNLIVFHHIIKIFVNSSLMCTMVIPFSFFFIYLFKSSPKHMCIDFRERASGGGGHWELRCSDIGALTMNGTKNLSEYRMAPQPTEPHWPKALSNITHGAMNILVEMCWHILCLYS